MVQLTELLYLELWKVLGLMEEGEFLNLVFPRVRVIVSPWAIPCCRFTCAEWGRFWNVSHPNLRRTEPFISLWLSSHLLLRLALALA